MDFQAYRAAPRRDACVRGLWAALSRLSSHPPTFLGDHVMRLEHRLPVYRWGVNAMVRVMWREGGGVPMPNS